MSETIKAIGLNRLGLNGSDFVFRNLPVETLVQDIIANNEGSIAANGAAMVDTGSYTGRSPKDKYIVKEPSCSENIWWGPINQEITDDVFDELYLKVIDYYNRTISKTYVFDGFAGADPAYSIRVRFLVKKAWQAHFVHNMFIRPQERELNGFSPDFTIINASDVKNIDFERHGLNSETFIIFHLAKRIAIIGGTEYGGEMKKGIFSVMNYMLPLQGVLAMHCSANVDKNGENPAIFFGLSGTGKTTLSTDPERPLIGDDEHGWSDDGIFNFEGGCYAKVIDLNPEHEPDIYHAIRHGALLENVVFDEETKEIDFTDASKTQNTRVSYPLNYIDNSVGMFEPDLEIALQEADVVMTLRIQNERLAEKLSISSSDYIERFQLNIDSLKPANKDVILLHPGPINFGIELSKEVVELDNCKIKNQIFNGVGMRMAILTKLFSQA